MFLVIFQTKLEFVVIFSLFLEGIGTCHYI